MNISLLKPVALWFTVGLIVGLLVGMAIGWRLDRRVAELTAGSVATSTSTTNTNGTPAATNNGTSSWSGVTLNDQPAGRAVVVANITLAKAAWVSIREILPSGDLGKVLGAVRRDAGVYTNLVVDLVTATNPNMSYALVLYADSGSKTFSSKSLTIIPGMDGKEAVTDFMATTPLSPSGQ